MSRVFSERVTFAAERITNTSDRKFTIGLTAEPAACSGSKRSYLSIRGCVDDVEATIGSERKYCGLEQPDRRDLYRAQRVGSGFFRFKKAAIR